MLCLVCAHGEVGPHCLTEGCLSALLRVLTDHPDDTLRGCAANAATSLLRLNHALHPLLEIGEIAPLLSLLHARTPPNPQAYTLETGLEVEQTRYLYYKQ